MPCGAQGSEMASGLRASADCETRTVRDSTGPTTTSPTVANNTTRAVVRRPRAAFSKTCIGMQTNNNKNTNKQQQQQQQQQRQQQQQQQQQQPHQQQQGPVGLLVNFKLSCIVVRSSRALKTARDQKQQQQCAGTLSWSCAWEHASVKPPQVGWLVPEKKGILGETTRHMYAKNKQDADLES
ncbi:unnamed protein product [Polarella glacialis]|uniref:Uncharacterized protein n=1 Tax=Polarella glacialis TaxID=89957 RepID=A0A813H0Y5_POLGL|nr:unnamed protein product [Polarella glacialis]